MVDEVKDAYHVNIKVTHEMLEGLRKVAHAHRRSMHKEIQWALEQYIKAAKEAAEADAQDNVARRHEDANNIRRDGKNYG